MHAEDSLSVPTGKHSAHHSLRRQMWNKKTSVSATNSAQ